MSEMSLWQQIKQIEDMIQYIKLICDDAKILNENISNKVSYLRQNGLRTETADFIQQVYMGTINDKLKKMSDRLKDCDLRFLEDEKRDLETAIGE